MSVPLDVVPNNNIEKQHNNKGCKRIGYKWVFKSKHDSRESLNGTRPNL